MPGSRSRNKGASAEREAASALQAIGINARRSARNGVDSAADLVGWPGVHVEVKRRASLAIEPWMCQAEESAMVEDGGVPVLLTRCDRGDWIVCVRLGNLRALKEVL